MPSLFLSAPVRLEEVPDSDDPAEVSCAYRTAYIGVLSLCEKYGWRCYQSKFLAPDEAMDSRPVVLSTDVFVALRFAGMRTAIMPTFHLGNAVGRAPSGKDRVVLVLKLEPTTEYDELWLGQPGAFEFIGGPQPMLEKLREVMAGREGA